MKKKILVFAKKVYSPLEILENAILEIEDGIIKKVKDNVSAHEADHYVGANSEDKCEFIYADIVAPGYVDVHIQGCGGRDFIDADDAQTKKILQVALRGGCTKILPTITIANSDKDLKTFKTIMRQIGENKNNDDGAFIPGIHLEGPFINLERRGGFPPEFVRTPTLKEFKEIVKIVEEAGGPGFFKMITIAPELENSEEVIKAALDLGITVSLGHTTANYELGKKFFDMGVDHVTHVFNAMHGLGHREPNLLGAALDDDEVFCQVIPDGKHIHPAVLRILHKVKGYDRLPIISDATAPCGLPEGTVVSSFNGTSTFKVVDGAVRNAEGNLAGSALLMDSAVRSYEKFVGIDREELFAMASTIPVQSYDIEAEDILIEEGMPGDILVLDKELFVKKVIHNNVVTEIE